MLPLHVHLMLACSCIVACLHMAVRRIPEVGRTALYETRAAQQKVTGHMQKSTEVMKMMGKLCKVSEISATMQEMQKEMMKAGVIEEMVDSAMEALDEDEDEDAADEEVERVMTELNAENFKKAESAPTRQPAVAPAAAEQAAVDDEEEEDMAAMRERLAMLKS